MRELLGIVVHDDMKYWRIHFALRGGGYRGVKGRFGIYLSRETFLPLMEKIVGQRCAVSEGNVMCFGENLAVKGIRHTSRFSMLDAIVVTCSFF